MIFTIKNPKTAKNVLDKRALAAGIATPALQFLQTEKRKYVRSNSQTSCRYNCPILQFSRSEKRKYIYTTNLTSYWYNYLCIMILISRKAKIVLGYTDQASGIRYTLYFAWKNKYWLLILVAPHVLGS